MGRGGGGQASGRGAAGLGRLGPDGRRHACRRSRCLAADAAGPDGGWRRLLAAQPWRDLAHKHRDFPLLKRRMPLRACCRTPGAGGVDSVVG